MLRHTALLLAILFAMPGESEAQEAESRLRTASAPLLLLSGPHKETRFLASAMVDIARRDGGAFVDLRVPPQLPPVAPAELRRAVAAYQEFDYERAMRHLGIAFSELANSGVQTVSNSELCDLFIYRALVRNAQGDTSKSWNDFVQAALIDPTRHLDAVRFSPSVAASFERARKAVIDGPAHLLSVELLSVERSDDCRLIVDGLERGRHTAVSLRAGRHFLQLSCAGYRDYSEEVLVDKDLSLRPRLEKPKTPSLVEAPALATERGFRHVVFVQVPFTSPKNTALFVLMGADGNELGRTSMMLAATSDDKPVAMTALSRLLDLLTPRSSVPLVVVQQRSWYQTPWIWAVAGAVATSAVLLPFALRDQSNTGFRIELGGETP